MKQEDKLREVLMEKELKCRECGKVIVSGGKFEGRGWDRVRGDGERKYYCRGCSQVWLGDRGII